MTAPLQYEDNIKGCEERGSVMRRLIIGFILTVVLLLAAPATALAGDRRTGAPTGDTWTTTPDGDTWTSAL